MRDLTRAKLLLENPGLTARLASRLGSPLENGFKMLPDVWSRKVHAATRVALLKSLHVAVKTLQNKPVRASSEKMHKLLVGASGGIGGALGLASLVVELPISTTIMLRSIADIARSEGHDLDSHETRLNCLEVFALGGRSALDDAAESSYWAVRAALAKSISEAASLLAEKGALEKSALAIARLIAPISSRFGAVVSEQMVAKALPIIGAASGSIINILFMNHFQDMARGHFIVRRLEKQHGFESVRAQYESLAI